MTKKERKAHLMTLSKEKLVSKIIALEDKNEELLIDQEVRDLGDISKDELLNYLLDCGYTKKEIKKWYPHLYE